MKSTTTRRAVLAGAPAFASVAAGVSPSTAAATMAPAEPSADAELFALVDQYLETHKDRSAVEAEMSCLLKIINRRTKRSKSTVKQERAYDEGQEHFEELNAKVCDIDDQIAGIPARSVDGLIAEARVARAAVPDGGDLSYSPATGSLVEDLLRLEERQGKAA